MHQRRHRKNTNTVGTGKKQAIGLIFVCADVFIQPTDRNNQKRRTLLMADSSVQYSLSEQLTILWWCLGTGGFLAVIVFCWCLRVNMQPKNTRHQPLPQKPAPLFSAALSENRHLLPFQVVASTAVWQAEKKVECEKVVHPQQLQPHGYEDSLEHSDLPTKSGSQRSVAPQPTFIHPHLQVAALHNADLSSDSMVQEMMMFSEQALLCARLTPRPVTAALELNTRPPADAYAAAEEMMMYANAASKSILFERS